VDIAYEPRRARYQVIVRRKMPALHRDIQILLAELSERAAKLGGEKDGWGKDILLMSAHIRWYLALPLR
jgi:hypothetical protein